MSTQIKLIIPLLDPTITKDDISNDAGFVDGYLYDINKPQDDDCIFLMYKADTDNIKAVRREDKFKKSPYIKNKRFIYLDHVCYIVYTFSILNNDVRLIKQNLPISSINDTFRILSFWEGKDESVNRAIVWTSEPYTMQTEMVPEEDYFPSKAESYAILHETINPEIL